MPRAELSDLGEAVAEPPANLAQFTDTLHKAQRCRHPEGRLWRSHGV